MMDPLTSTSLLDSTIDNFTTTSIDSFLSDDLEVSANAFRNLLIDHHIPSIGNGGDDLTHFDVSTDSLRDQKSYGFDIVSPPSDGERTSTTPSALSSFAQQQDDGMSLSTTVQQQDCMMRSCDFFLNPCDTTSLIPMAGNNNQQQGYLDFSSQEVKPIGYSVYYPSHQENQQFSSSPQSFMLAINNRNNNLNGSGIQYLPIVSTCQKTTADIAAALSNNNHNGMPNNSRMDSSSTNNLSGGNSLICQQQQQQQYLSPLSSPCKNLSTRNSNSDIGNSNNTGYNYHPNQQQFGIQVIPVCQYVYNTNSSGCISTSPHYNANCYPSNPNSNYDVTNRMPLSSINQCQQQREQQHASSQLHVNHLQKNFCSPRQCKTNEIDVRRRQHYSISGSIPTAFESEVEIEVPDGYSAAIGMPGSPEYGSGGLMQRSRVLMPVVSRKDRNSIGGSTSNSSGINKNNKSRKIKPYQHFVQKWILKKQKQ